MPTRNRRDFVPAAIQYFLRQNYAYKELIVVDDGEDPVRDLIPPDERIQYIRLAKRASVGAKRNLACERAQGAFIAHWDDDDWHAPSRLSYQVSLLRSSGASLCGLQTLRFFDLVARRAWVYRCPDDALPRLACGTLCYRRSVWELRPFADVDVAEDARLFWELRGNGVLALEDSSFYVASLHEQNSGTSILRTGWWETLSVDALKQQLADEWLPYVERRLPGAQTTARPFRNVYACLVHESRECVVDLVRNLRYTDPDSAILLYDGGTDRQLLDDPGAFRRLGATIHPSPRPMRWGWLHDFALDSMRYALEHIGFDALTIVDSDQLSLRSGYSRALSRYFATHHATGMLGSMTSRQPAHAGIGPAAQAWRELELWRPFLRRFPGKEALFPQWTFWPGTVFRSDAARALVDFTERDVAYADLMRRTNIWASEEIVLPTLTALLGFAIDVHPTNFEYVQFRANYSIDDVERALSRSDAYWMHPVPRQYGDTVRAAVRHRLGDYSPGVPSDGDAGSDDTDPLLLALPIIEQMRSVEGWLSDEEADLLVALTARALLRAGLGPAILEVGSYCGRSTSVLGCTARVVRPDTRIFAVDPHDGLIGSNGQGLTRSEPTLEKFRTTMQRANLTAIVHEIVAKSTDVDWNEPLDVLLIDGLHDYASVAKDFAQFARFVTSTGYVAFHDYAPYYPGVMAFVDERIAEGSYRRVALRGSLCVLQRRQGASQCSNGVAACEGT